MKVKNLFLALIAFSLLLVGCEKEETVTGVSLNSTSVDFEKIGDTQTLTATLSPAGVKADVTWKSSDTKVATVEGNGLTAVVTAVGKGKAKITASVDIFTAEVNVFVNANTNTGAGSKESPYSVEYVIGKSSGNKDVIDQPAVWVKGIVVGRYDSNSKSITTEDPDGVNLVIAASATEKDVKNAVCVQVPLGDIRNGLSIKDNPSIVGKEIIVHGDITTYNTMAGVKNTDGYWKIAENTGINPPEKGNFDVPVMSISELVAMYKGSDVQLKGEKKIVGVVTSDLEGGNSTSKKNIVITSENNTSGVAIRFSDKDNTYVLGDKIEVLLTGSLTAYAEAPQLSVAIINTAKVGKATITPRTATVADIVDNIANYEFCVVTLQGTLTGPSGATTFGKSDAHQSNTLSNGGKSVIVFVAKYATFINEKLPTGNVTLTGIAQRFNADRQLIIRNMSDVK